LITFRILFTKSGDLLGPSLDNLKSSLKLRLSSEVIRAERERLAVKNEMGSSIKKFLKFSSEIVAEINRKLNDIGKFGVKDSSTFQTKVKLAVKEYNRASVLFLDLDNFKSVNDNYGHITGDQVIREALEVVKGITQEEGELFHRSGDEMLVLLPNANDESARDIAERIRAGIENYNFSTIGRSLVTTTIGLATYPETCERWEDLENTADQLAMNAKRTSKNSVATS